MRNLTLFVGVLVLLMVSTVALSQEKTKEELSRDLMDAMKMEETMRITTEKMMEQMKLQMPAVVEQAISNMDLPEKAMEGFDEFMNKYATKYMNGIMDSMTEMMDIEKLVNDIYVPLYARYYTDEELAKLAEFYRSPLGEKMIEVLPDLTAEATAEIMNTMGAKMGSVMSEMLKQIEKDIEEEFDIEVDSGMSE